MKKWKGFLIAFSSNSVVSQSGMYSSDVPNSLLAYEQKSWSNGNQYTVKYIQANK